MIYSDNLIAQQSNFQFNQPHQRVVAYKNEEES